jgi:spore coat protein A
VTTILRERIIGGVALLVAPLALAVSNALAEPLPGGSLDPLTIEKDVIPLVIPPEMPASPKKSAYNKGRKAQYNIANRQFQQQILPGGIWATLNPAIANPLPATPVGSYGRAEDPIPPGDAALGIPPGVAPVPANLSSFNYPAFTMENTADTPRTVRWVNELVAVGTDDYPCSSPMSTRGCTATFLPHVVTNSVDQTLHWANPNLSTCSDGTVRTDCRPDPNITINPTLGQPYNGPVPMVVHVHGAHVNPDSDGYPEAWWLPAAGNIPAGYATKGSQFGEANNNNILPGSAFFSYRNDQAATTIWYHDHSLGMTHNNVYAGPAGFWLIRGTYTDPVSGQQVPDTPTDGVKGGPAVLPGQVGVIPGYSGRPTDPTAGGCDPNFHSLCRASIREIPVLIQDRSFNADGTLFYAQSRDFFNLTQPNVTVPYMPYDPATCRPTMSCSDISPIWNPEFFGNTNVVNGNTWPDFQVTPQRYRLRLLNGSDARTYNLSLWIVPPKKGAPARNAYTLNSQQLIDREKFVEMPVYQIGADQGFLPKVVKVQTGCSVQLAGDGSIPQCPTLQPDDPHLSRALLVAPAERADVILDFSALPVGTVVRMVNTGPDEPFGGLPSEQSDKDTTGQVMSFTVVTAGAGITDPSTPVENLVMPTDIPIAAASNTRTLSLNEAESEQICVKVNAVNEKIEKVVLTLPTPAAPGTIADICAQVNAVPFEPREALLGTLPGGTPAPQHWQTPSPRTRHSIARRSGSSTTTRTMPTRSTSIWCASRSSIGRGW